MNRWSRTIIGIAVGLTIYRLITMSPDRMAENPILVLMMAAFIGFGIYHELAARRRELAQRLKPLLKTVADRELAVTIQARAADFDRAFECRAYRDGGRVIINTGCPAGFNTVGRADHHFCLIMARSGDSFEIRAGLFDADRAPRGQVAAKAALTVPAETMPHANLAAMMLSPEQALNRWVRIESSPGHEDFNVQIMLGLAANAVSRGLAARHEASDIMAPLNAVLRDHLSEAFERALNIKKNKPASAPTPPTPRANPPAPPAGFWDPAIQAARRADSPAARSEIVADLDSGMAVEAAVAKVTGLDQRLVAAIAASDWARWGRDYSLKPSPFWRDAFPKPDDPKAQMRRQIIAHLTTGALPTDAEGWSKLGRAILSAETLADAAGIEAALTLSPAALLALPRLYPHQLDTVQSNIAVYLLAPLVPDRPDRRRAKSLEPAAGRLLARLPAERLAAAIAGETLGEGMRRLGERDADSRPLPALPFAVAPDGSGIGGFETTRLMKRAGAGGSALPAEAGRYLVRIERPGRYGTPELAVIAGGPPFAAETPGRPALDWYVARLNDGTIPVDRATLEARAAAHAAHRAAIDLRLGYDPNDAAFRDRVFEMVRTPLGIAPGITRTAWEDAVARPLLAETL